MNTPLVTIIVPVYNSEKYISRCIQKLLNQTYRNLQIIIVNDGSTDRSLDICRMIKDDRVEVYTKENGGASSARNLGLTHRKGEYILFVDSDDYLLENAIETLVERAIATNADCIYFEAENKAEHPGITVKKNGFLQCCNYPDTDGKTLIELLIENKNFHAGPVLYFTKSSVYDLDLQFEEGIMFEDELFTYELLCRCKKVVCLRRVLYIRVVRSNSVMTSHGKEEFRFHSITVVFERLLEQYKVKNNDYIYCLYLSRIAMLWIDYYRQMHFKDRKKVKEKYCDLREHILKHKGYGNKELVMRCYGEVFWIVYITPNRIMKKLKRK